MNHRSIILLSIRHFTKKCFVLFLQFEQFTCNKHVHIFLSYMLVATNVVT